MSKPSETPEVVEIFTVSLEDIAKHGWRECARLAKLKAERVAYEAEVRAAFRDKAHARQVWDDWDGLDSEGEMAHAYLNLIGDGHYCAV